MSSGFTDDEVARALTELSGTVSWRGSPAWETVIATSVLTVSRRVADRVSLRRSERDSAMDAATEAIVAAIKDYRGQHLSDPLGWMYRIGQRAASKELLHDAHHGITGLRDQIDHRPTWATRPDVVSLDVGPVDRAVR